VLALDLGVVPRDRPAFAPAVGDDARDAGFEAGLLDVDERAERSFRVLEAVLARDHRGRPEAHIEDVPGKCAIAAVAADDARHLGTFTDQPFRECRVEGTRDRSSIVDAMTARGTIRPPRPGGVSGIAVSSDEPTPRPGWRVRTIAPWHTSALTGSS